MAVGEDYGGGGGSPPAQHWLNPERRLRDGLGTGTPTDPETRPPPQRERSDEGGEGGSDADGALGSAIRGLCSSPAPPPPSSITHTHTQPHKTPTPPMGAAGQ